MWETLPPLVLVDLEKMIGRWQKSTLEKQIQRNLRRPGMFLGRRTGALARNVDYYRLMMPVSGGVGGVKLVVNVDSQKVPYAKIHEEGGTIRPKTKTYLTIPTKNAMTRAGVKRKSALDYEDDPKYRGTFVMMKDGWRGPIIFGRPVQRNKKPVPLFLLRKEVKIDAKHWAEYALRRSLSTLERELSKHSVEISF